MPRINTNQSTSSQPTQAKPSERKPISQEKLDRLRANTQAAIDILSKIESIDKEIMKLKNEIGE